MTKNPPILTEISDHFESDGPPVLFQRLASLEGVLTTTWQQYRTAMLTGELDRSAKELIGLAVAVAKSNEYVIALQNRQLCRVGLGPEEESEALAVASFFEGFDAFAHSLRVDSDLRPRKLEAGDMSLIDREVDVNVRYVLRSENPTVGKVYDEIKSRMGIPFVPNIFKALAHQPQMLEAKWESYKAVMLGGRLRRLTKELIAVAVSAVNGCFY
jgi:alkylhydroperoxidase/carboxymuconolactone decarboxylase family protein YurZ